MSLVRLLVVDDSPEVRELLTMAASQRPGLDVVGTAGSGLEAIDEARRLHPDLVILDIGMPVLDGISALSGLREAAPEALIVMVSGFDRNSFERIARDRGAVGYVEKGHSPNAILDEVLEVAGVLERVRSVLAAVRSQLSASRESGREARRLASAALESWQLGEAGDAVELIVTELVANSVLHAGSAPEIAVLLLPDAIRLEVADSSPDLPRPRDAGPEATSGRGMNLIDAMATRWGADPTPTGKTVWVEISRNREE